MSMNVDWFEPFERGVYSTGVIYLTILNLPRNERYKPENIIVIGIIPGPKEPKKTINSYLMPLVYELQEAWEHGINVKSHDNSIVCIKLALSCITCDIPATRKVCGFLGHNATLGCNKCLKKFDVTFGEKTDFSGFDTDEWVPHSLQQHTSGIKEVSAQTTKTAKSAAESKCGVRYSVLLELSYFDPIEYTAVDVMHNLFLGTGKHVFSVWIETGILSKKNLKSIEENLKLFKVPNDVGRLPSQIFSSYGSFTANQWKNWICVYSCVILKDILPPDHFTCWKLFVRSCVILCSYSIDKNDISSADLFLKQFCCMFMRIYGPDKCSFNMHLHLHLKQMLLDFGPTHTTWCYAYERFNGFLGSYHTNHKAIEPQIMKRFLQHQGIYSSSVPHAELKSILPQVHGDQLKSDSDLMKSYDSLFLLHYATNKLDTIQTFTWTTDMRAVLPLAPFYEEIFYPDEFSQLKHVYELLYPEKNFSQILVPVSYQKFGRLKLAGDIVGSDMPGVNSRKSAVIMAYWPSCSIQQNLNIDYSTMQVGVVKYFVKHKLCVKNINSTDKMITEYHLFAYVSWKKLHRKFDWFGAAVTVCESFSEFCCSNFLPVQRQWRI